METYRNFYAKILLFGEYSVICNSMGLTVPYASYSGRLRQTTKPTKEQQQSMESLRGLYHYLRRLSGKSLSDSLNLQAFDEALNNGLYFDSDIPKSYGIGSSGALCAAIFDRFGLGKNKYDLAGLKRIFASMESYFHGTSSGLDPLISYLNKPLLIKNKETLEVTKMPQGLLSNKLTTFLVNTGQHGKTDNLVQMFLEKCRSGKFLREVDTKLIPLNNHCIHKYMEADMQNFLGELKQLSAFFLEHFRPMIPGPFQELWKKGLEDNSPYSLKLCGSGGGGYLLGFTGDFETAKKEFQNYNIAKIIL